jgi:TolA-binding protein
MKIRDELQKRIEKKQLEIRELEKQLAAANAYIEAMQDSLKLLPKDSAGGKVGPEQTLRPGSTVAKAREAILKAGKPLHITEILKAIDRPVDKNNRVSLSGSLSGYVKRGEIFTRPAPNTFGLAALNHDEMPVEEPPEDFGSLPGEGAAHENEVEETQGITDDDVPF